LSAIITAVYYGLSREAKGGDCRKRGSRDGERDVADGGGK
jgi:hypothetical protein